MFRENTWRAGLFVLVVAFPLTAQAPPDADWTANAVLEHSRQLTVTGLGAAQGVSFHEGKVYLYGDVHDVKPRVGVIREYTRDLKPTGRVVWLRKDGMPLLIHPTGLTWDSKWGTFLGDTVKGNAVIYRLDWKKAWEDGHLDNAVRDVIRDDAAVNGCRPEFVQLKGRVYLATADYGDVRPKVRLYDPEKLLTAKRSSAPGVVAHRILCGPFNQNLHWDAGRGQLTCVQNVIAGRGWQLDIIDLAKAVADGRASGPGVLVRRVILPYHDELEGYRPFSDSKSLFITSSRKNNVVLGEIQTVAAYKSPAKR
jgi:hypothetical protein